MTGEVHSGETSAEAAVREVAEETGLEAVLWMLTGHVATFYFEPFDAVVLSPVIACEIGATDEPTLSHEHSEYRWLGPVEARGLLGFASHREGIEIIEEIVRIRDLR